MCHLLNSVITLADLDVIIKELHKFVLSSIRFIDSESEQKQEAGEPWSTSFLIKLAFCHPGELRLGDFLPDSTFCLTQKLFSFGCDTA